MTDKQIQEAAEKWYPVEYAGSWYIQLGEMYNDKSVLDADCVGYEQAKLNAELICEQHNQLSTSNVIEYLEQILNPKYQNDVFTWKQFIDALEGAKWMQSQSQWIPVTERLPDLRSGTFSRNVMIETIEGERYKATYHWRLTGNIWLTLRDGHEFYESFVTKWCPLPEPPKTEQP